MYMEGRNEYYCPFDDRMRTNEIRLSDTEKNRLHNYKTEKFDETVPYGFIIGRLLDEVEE